MGEEDHGRGTLLAGGWEIAGLDGTVEGIEGYVILVDAVATSVGADESESKSRSSSSTKSFSSKSTVSCSFPTLPPSLNDWLRLGMLSLLRVESRRFKEDSCVEFFAVSVDKYPPIAWEAVLFNGFFEDSQGGREELRTAEALGCIVFVGPLGCCDGLFNG